MNTINNLKTVQDVETFFYHLLNDLKINFHVDIPFEDYINVKSKKEIMSKKQANIYHKKQTGYYNIHPYQTKQAIVVVIE